jgi:hypothetical protein
MHVMVSIMIFYTKRKVKQEREIPLALDHTRIRE